MNALNELLDALHENNITRVLRMEPLAYVKAPPSGVPSTVWHKAPWFTFVNEHGNSIFNMDINLIAMLEQQVDAVIAPLAGSHYTPSPEDQEVNEFPLPTHVVTEIDASTGIVSDSYTSEHLARQIHNGNLPFNSNLLPTLKDLGVSAFQVGYQGCSDNGEVLDVSCTNENGQTVIINTSIVNQIEALAYHLLEAHESGWEINEGSEGELTLNVKTGEIQINHNNNLSEIDTSSYSQRLSELGDDYTADLKVAHDELVAVMPEGMTLYLDYKWVESETGNVNNDITESDHTDWTRFIRNENEFFGESSKELTKQEREIALRFARPLIARLVEGGYKDSSGTFTFNRETDSVTVEDSVETKDSEYSGTTDRLITAIVYDPSDEVEAMKPTTPKM